MSENNNLKSQTIGGVIWKGLERVSAQIVSAVVSIILARILMPEDYSVVSIVTIFFTFCNIFISGGLNTALIQKKDSDIFDYSTILFTNLIMASILYIVLFFCAPLIANLFEKDILVPVIRVMSLTFFVNSYKAVLSAKITSDMKFKKFFWSTLGGTIASAVVGIVMAVKGFGAWALVAQQMTNVVIDSLILSFTSQIKIKFVFSWNRFKPLFKFGGKIMVSSIINETYNQVCPLIVGIKFSSIDLAYYNKGKTYPELIASVGNDTLSSSLFPAMSKVQDDKEKILLMTRRFIQLSSFFVFPLMIGFFAVSENFVHVLLTDKWLPIVPYLMIFCISEMFKPIQTGNLQAIKAIGRSDVFLVLEIVKKTLYLVVILLFVFLTNKPILLALSSIIISLIASLVNTFPNRKLLKYGYKKQFADLALNFVTAAVMGVAVFFMKYIPINSIILLVLQIVTGITFYFGFAYLTRNKNLLYLLNMLKVFLSNRKNKKQNKNRCINSGGQK